LTEARPPAGARFRFRGP